jgi:hypothetical protein
MMYKIEKGWFCIIYMDTSLPPYELYTFVDGQKIRHTITNTCKSIWVGTYSKNNITYKGNILSLDDFGKSHRDNIIVLKDAHIDEIKEYEVDGEWIHSTI